MTDYSESLNMMSALGQQPVTFLGEVSVEPLAAVGIIETALTEVKDNLTEFAASGTFEEDMLTVFGESANVDLGETIIDALAVGENLPQIIVVPEEQMNGASGGFDSLTGTVYLADSLINPNSVIASETPSVIASETPSVIASETPSVIASEAKQSPNLADVLTEELGHYIDSQLNRIDTPGDEGEHFAALVRGEVLSWEDVGRLRVEDDRVRILGGLVEVEADDSAETAIDLGVLAQDATSIVGDIGFGIGRRRDQRDYYRFELREETNVELTLDEMSRNANLHLYEGSDSRLGSLLATSRNPGNQPEAIAESLQAGTYYLQVSPYGSGKTGYSLNLSASELMIDPDSTPELANDIGKLTQEKPFRMGGFEMEYIGFTFGGLRDSQDWYRFELEEEGEVDVTLGILRGNAANLRLYDSNIALLSESRKPGRSPEEIEATLSAGVYYLEVTAQGNAKASYKLDASVQTPETTPPEISISDATITEGNRGRKNAKFQITLDAKPEETVRVNYATANATAKAGTDYKPTKGILTFKPGQTRKTITVPILGDTQIENNETFQLNLSKPRNAQLKDRRGIGTIRDNDFAKLSIKDTQITEGDNGKKQAKFTVALNQKINERVQVNYATSDITAKEGSDYQQTQGKLTFKPNQKRKTITVPILGDTFDEDNEKFSVTLRKPSKGVKLGDKRAIGTIKDNGDKGQADGDTLKTAIDFGKLLEKEVISNDIGATIGLDRDTDDYYRFQVSREGTLRVFLDSLFEDANVELLGSGEELISQSENDGTSAEEIIQVLDPDTYYLRVYPNSGDRTSYRLSVNFI